MIFFAKDAEIDFRKIVKEMYDSDHFVVEMKSRDTDLNRFKIVAFRDCSIMKEALWPHEYISNVPEIYRFTDPLTGTPLSALRPSEEVIVGWHFVVFDVDRAIEKARDFNRYIGLERKIEIEKLDL